MTRVLHVIPSMSALSGGPSVIVREMSESLVRAGFSVDVATTDDDGPGRLAVPLNAPVVENGVTYRYFRRQARLHTFSEPLAYWLSAHVGEYDLLHIHALFSFSTLPAAYWASRKRVPYIVCPHGMLNRWCVEQRRPWLKKISFAVLERRVLRAAAAVHYASEQERIEAELLGEVGLPLLIPNWIDLARIAPYLSRGRFRRAHPELASRRIILFLSRFDRKKGLDLLFAAFAAVQRAHPDTVLVLAGSGSPEPRGVDASGACQAGNRR